jgi:hypothetical protein
MKSIYVLVACILLCGTSQQYSSAETVATRADYYVSVSGSDDNPGTLDMPFASLHRAQDAARKRIAEGLTGNITMFIRAGTYLLDEPLSFDIRDSGTERYSITYAAYPGERPLVSGGSPITGWEKTAGTMWKTHIPEVLAGEWEFRQLFADDSRLTRARFPNEGERLTVEGVQNIQTYSPEVERQTIIAETDFPGDNLAHKGTEIVMFHSWTISRSRIMHTKDRNITSDYPIGLFGFSFGEAKPKRTFYLEHALEFIDAPGEWYLDRDTGTLYYMAEAGENPNDREFIAPKHEKIIAIKGTKISPVRNVHFEGLNFEHCSWRIPLGGYAPIQAGFYSFRYPYDPAYALPLAIQLEYSEDCLFEKCRLAHTGASGLGFGAGCDRNKVLGCEFYDVGGNGVMVGWRRKTDDPPRKLMENDWEDVSDAPDQNELSHNHIHHCASVQFGCVGVFTAFSGNTRITHNVVHDLSYSGMSIGFCWHDFRTSQRNALIAYNHVYNCMMTLADGAGMYILGYQPGTKIMNNLVHDIENGRSFYNDGTTSHLYYENNISYNVEESVVHKGHHNTFRNNIFASARKSYIYVAARAVYLWQGYDAPPPTSYFENNIFYMDSGKLFGRAGVGTPYPFYESKYGRNPYFRSNNIYWDPRQTPDALTREELKQYQDEDNDIGSIFADPLFVDPARHNYTLKPDSPALELGFKPIDISSVGPQDEYTGVVKGYDQRTEN